MFALPLETHVSIRKKFSGISSYSNPASDWKNDQFTPYLFVGELTYEDLPMDMTKLKFAVHS